MIEDNKYEKGTLGWLKEQAKKDGFDNIRNWQNWKKEQKKEQEWHKELEDKYGKEFADWAIENKDKVPNKWINAGCKTDKEYQNKCAQDAGFKDKTERDREWTHKTGRNFPKEDNPDCSSWFGYISENYVMKTFEDPIPMPSCNPGFDWKCKKGQKIDHKGRCLEYSKVSNWSGWKFPIGWNNIADYFILSAWDNRDSLTPLHVWIFHKNDIIRGRKFWRRDTIVITNTSLAMIEFKEHEVTDRLDKLKELCNRHKHEEDKKDKKKSNFDN